VSANNKYKSYLPFWRSRHFLLLFSFFIFHFLPIHAEDGKIDSLLTIINKDSKDTNRVNSLNALCKVYNKNGKIDKAIESANEAAKLAEELNFFKGESEAYNNIGSIYFTKRDYNSTLIYFQKALRLSEKAGDKFKERAAIVIDNIGLVYEAQGDYSKAQDYYSKALKIAEGLKDKRLQAYTMGNIGNFYTMQGNDSKALEYYLKAVKMKEELGDKNGVAMSSSNIGLQYKGQGDYPKALEYYFKALKMAQELGDKQLEANTISNIGTVYREQGDYSKALEYDFKTLNLAEEIKYTQLQASAAGNIGLVYWGRSDYSKALEYYGKALKIAEESGDKNTEAIIADNIGIVCENQGDLPQALDYEFKALKLSKEVGDKNGTAVNTGNIGEIYIKQKKYKDAEKYILQAIYLADTIKLLEAIQESNLNLSQLFSQTGEWKKAYEAFKQYSNAKDSIAVKDKSRDIGRIEAKSDYDKRLLIEKAEDEKNAALALVNSKRRKIIMGLVLAIALAVALIALIIFRSLKITRKQREVIEQQKEEVENQKALMEEKNKDILDSITYAKRLQDAIFPQVSLIKHYLPESFVFYKPKDIVAGDFYWMTQLTVEGNETVFLASADCTGNGVQGAMVSVICSDALNATVKEFGITVPGKILEKSSELIAQTFQKNTENVNDGMDISLVAINMQQDAKGLVNIKWSGANIPLWIVSNGSVLEVSPDKQSVGKQGQKKPFATHGIDIKKGDILYLFSNGYAEQLGSDGIGYAAFREKLLEISLLSMEEQEKKLAETLKSITNQAAQLDDILIMGIRV
jgi:tetratricopeptide (TPR) repeat protein/serine phosphatase RsbU (regulator of sigma subunit)